jgi:glutamate synthase (NADPH/NADH) large chain
MTISNLERKKHIFWRRTKKKTAYFWNSLEDLELILHPMAEMQKKRPVLMGDDTPLAVLSDKYRPFISFFQDKIFSQVTNHQLTR